MNQDSAQNNLDNLPFGPTDQTLNFTEELTVTDLESLIKKYGHNPLFAKIFKPDERFFSVFDNINFRQHLFESPFWPVDQKFTLTRQEGWKIIELFASATDENYAKENLNKINSQLIIPNNFDFASTQAEAQKLNTAYRTAVSLLLDDLTVEFLPDTLNFNRMETENLENMRIEIDEVTKEIAKQIELGNVNNFLPKNLSDEIAHLLNQIGRAQFSANEQKIFSQVSDIFEKLDIAVQAALSLKKLNIPNGQNIEDLARQEIKKVLQPSFYP